jgi:hypothetical protein
MPTKKNLIKNVLYKTLKTYIHSFIEKFIIFLKDNNVHFEQKNKNNTEYFLYDIKFQDNLDLNQKKRIIDELRKIIDELYFQKEELLEERTIEIFDDAEYIKYDKTIEFDEKYIKKLYDGKIKITLKENVESEETLYIKKNDYNSLSEEILVFDYKETNLNDKLVSEDIFDKEEFKKRNHDYFNLNDKKIILYLYNICEINYKKANKELF